MLNTEEKVAHLLRHLGLGASYREIQSYSRLGIDGAINQLIHYEGIQEDYNVSPWAFTYINSEKNPISLDNPRFVSWWSTQMLFTNRPLQENLALFWHNHFAVSGAKIEYGPEMLEYLQTIRKNANGNFRDLLGKISREPAMIHWLDSDTNIKGTANENFGREVMELFTLGVGNYTETDVKQNARAFTGWATKYSVNFPRGTSTLDQVKLNLAAGRPMVCFCDCPALHDDDFKTVLGKRGPWGPDDMFDILVREPSHAPFLMKKVWEWFVYPNPEPAELEKLCEVYIDHKFEMKPVMEYIATCDAFWSDKAQRSIVKSPVAYTIGIMRQLDLFPFYAKKVNMDAGDTVMADNQLVGLGYFIANMMQKQGLELLFPPDVSGWRWGTRWITSATMMQRTYASTYLFKQRRGIVVPHLWEQIKKTYDPKTAEQIVDAITAWFDVPADQNDKKIMVQAANEAGGAKAFSRPGTAANVFYSVFNLATAIPQFQMA